MKKTPDIAIYRDGIRYRVEIEGKEIERLRSFAVKIDAYPPDGESEVPHCVIEQYMPINRLRAGGSNRQQAAAGQEEKR